MSQKIMVKQFKSSREFYNQHMLQQATQAIVSTTKQLANKYHVPLNKVAVKYNKRYRRTLGEADVSFSKVLSGTCDMTFNEKFVLGCLYDQQGGYNALLPVVKHEVLHYVTQFIDTKNSDDGASTFEKLLAENNAISSGTTNRNKRLAQTVSVGYVFENNALFKIIY